jgi:hypothetical protein
MFSGERLSVANRISGNERDVRKARDNSI